MIPFTSPIVMMVRLPFDVPVWETMLSVVLLYAAAFGMIWIAGKIYRVGILMYGAGYLGGADCGIVGRSRWNFR